jgi:gliding motility-associated-like protein
LLGSASGYQLLINTGNGYVEKAMIESSDSVYILNYEDIMYQVSGDKICFRIEASEDSNPYGLNGKSTSSEICISPFESVTVPNIFTPNHDLVNDYFRPVLSFTPKEYHLVISDLKRKIIFESTDYQLEWDGSFNGNPQPEGAYLWFLKIITPSGNNISKTGTVTIFFNQK